MIHHENISYRHHVDVFHCTFDSSVFVLLKTMASWWNSTGASNLTRGLTSITGQLSNNLKEILTEASEEHVDPTADLARARQQIEDLELRKQALFEEVVSHRWI